MPGLLWSWGLLVILVSLVPCIVLYTAGGEIMFLENINSVDFPFW